MLTRAHDAVVTWLLPSARWIGERPTELRATTRLADLVWEVALPPDERVLLHIEVQTDADSMIGERLAEYAILLWRRDRLPIRSVVIYLRETGATAIPPFVVAGGAGEEGMRDHFDVVRLWQESPERVLAMPDAGLWPLAPLMAGPAAETAALVAARIAQAPMPRSERSELIGLLAVAAGIRLPRPLVETLLRRNPMIRDLLEASSAAEIFREMWREKGPAEALEQGREQGLEQGRQVGRQQGELAGRRALARAILESRFGALRADELVAHGQADDAVLRELTPLLTAGTPDQWRSVLGLPALPRD